MKQLLIISVLLVFGLKGFGQIESLSFPNGKPKYEKFETDSGYVRYWYYENGNKKSESILDKDGTWISYKDWNENEILVEERNLLQERLDKGPFDLSFIYWNTLNKVDIFIQQKDTINNNIISIEKGDTIILHYKCLDEFGYEYDNSILRDEPLIVIVGNNYFLESFNEAINQLTIGDKAYVRIPYELGYGDKAAGNVPPKTNLVYYVDLLKIKKLK